MICGYILRKMDMYRNGVITNIPRKESNFGTSDSRLFLVLRFTENKFHRTDPDTDINLAANAGVTVFRMGIDWGRLVTKLPRSVSEARVQNVTALNRYREIVEKVKRAGMRPMVTLFHHSIPSWASQIGGWSNTTLKSYFAEFARDVSRNIDIGEDGFWVTFNEPTVFVLLTYCSGIWPPGPPQNMVNSLACIAPYGTFYTAMNEIQTAHNMVYKILKLNSKADVGVAHNVGSHVPNSIFDYIANNAADSMLTFPFIDAIKSNLDFCGLNYYGKEITKGSSVAILDTEEYSESGRCVYPDGLYELLQRFNDRYSKDDAAEFDYIITENGISDATDVRSVSVLSHINPQ